MLKKQDIFLFLALFIPSLLLWILLSVNSAAAAVCEISVDGVVVDSISLPADLDYPLDLYDIDVLIEIRGFSVSIAHSDCFDKLCEKMGCKSRGGESIICLPNRVTVRMLGGEASHVDAVSG